MKSFWLSYAFCHALTFVLTLITQDIIQSVAIAFLLSIAVFVFFDYFYFEDEMNEKSQVKQHEEDEYITILTLK